ncbi:MAG: ATP-binding protein [Acidobacteriota bacterium]|nr:ATP-binding protein [Blastocatellia bacterium]MDW8413737.1 ATP-binding protein [Acidobacteriota bacterium]
MKAGRLGSTYAVLWVLSILTTTAANLLATTLYTSIGSELTTERLRRQRAQATLFAMRVAALEVTELNEQRLAAIADDLEAAAVYNCDGSLRIKWHSRPNNHHLSSLLFQPLQNPSNMHYTRHGKESYALAYVPVPNSKQICGVQVAFKQIAVEFRSGQLIMFLSVLSLMTILLAGGLSARLLFSRVQQKRQDASEIIFESLQALIDSLQVKSAQLERMHSAQKRRAEFIELFNQRIVASIPSALVVVDLNGRVLITNAKASQMFAGRDLKPLEINYESLFRSTPRLVELITDCIKQRRSVELEELEAELCTGRAFLAVSISPISWQEGEPENGALILISDLTEVKHLRDRLAMQQNLANLGEMAAGLAHEFKNSLAAISGYGQLIESVSSNDMVCKASRALVEEVNSLSQMVTDFLNFARPQKPQLTRAKLRELVEDCVETLQNKCKQKAVQVEIEGTEVEISCDPSLLKRALINLIDNALDAVEPDTGKVKISIKQLDSYVSITVEDNGRGVAPEELKHIFIPFFTTKSKGYGIGLALVQKIILAHEGRIEVESQASQGARFTCLLPYKSHPG